MPLLLTITILVPILLLPVGVLPITIIICHNFVVFKFQSFEYKRRNKIVPLNKTQNAIQRIVRYCLDDMQICKLSRRDRLSVFCLRVPIYSRPIIMNAPQ